jgi:hypothetical protein
MWSGPCCSAPCSPGRACPWLSAEGIGLVFAELKDPVRDKIERYGLTRTIDPRHFFSTIESAVTAFRQETGAQWAAADQAATGEPPDILAAPPLG